MDILYTFIIENRISSKAPFQANKSSIFTIYPNSISNIATVEIHIPFDFNIIPGEKLELNIYDINGRLVDHYEIFL